MERQVLNGAENATIDAARALFLLGQRQAALALQPLFTVDEKHVAGAASNPALVIFECTRARAEAFQVLLGLGELLLQVAQLVPRLPLQTVRRFDQLE